MLEMCYSFIPKIESSQKICTRRGAIVIDLSYHKILQICHAVPLVMSQVKMSPVAHVHETNTQMYI